MDGLDTPSGYMGRPITPVDDTPNNPLGPGSANPNNTETTFQRTLRTVAATALDAGGSGNVNLGSQGGEQTNTTETVGDPTAADTQTHGTASVNRERGRASTDNPTITQRRPPPITLEDIAGMLHQHMNSYEQFMGSYDGNMRYLSKKLEEQSAINAKFIATLTNLRDGMESLTTKVDVLEGNRPATPTPSNSTSGDYDGTSGYFGNCSSSGNPNRQSGPYRQSGH